MWGLVRRGKISRHVISKDGTWVNPWKVEAVLKWSPPRIPLDIINFLELAGYYRRIIQKF